ncbi:hypothetical protein MTR_3g058290 [Medicago truncatula]|uniref:Uncharacterized protein n=1 Tax=Medicago truncatula TaxID=3880 RepID=A0A072V783_MEDTR|nr:hypothetical protein MTR_3g058290 [Medicago truncatula]
MCEVSWIHPPKDTIKVKVDGSSFNNPGRSSFDGILRNNNGVWLKTLRKDEFLRKTAFCPKRHSSLAIANDDSRLASDELHRSPRDHFSSPRKLRVAARHNEHLYSP